MNKWNLRKLKTYYLVQSRNERNFFVYFNSSSFYCACNAKISNKSILYFFIINNVIFVTNRKLFCNIKRPLQNRSFISQNTLLKYFLNECTKTIFVEFNMFSRKLYSFVNFKVIVSNNFYLYISITEKPQIYNFMCKM